LKNSSSTYFINGRSTMKTSESIDKLASALLKAQQAIRFAAKDSKNPHFKNSYADLESVIDAIKAPLNDNGIVFLQLPSPSDDGKLHLTTRLMHESGQWMEDTAVAPLPKQDPQGFGSTLTYLRRYSLSAVTGLYQADDDGNAGSGVGDRPTAKPAARSVVKPPAKPVDKSELDECIAALKECEDLDTLQGIFAGAWKRTSKEQQPKLKAAYDARKAELSTAEA
jgi:hypothetical protein